MTKPDIVLVVAAADNGVIGRDNALPWRLPSDLKHFKALTLGKPIIMGRKTFQSIGKPLPGRTNIVVTRDASFHADGIVAATSLDAALEVGVGDAQRRGVDQIAIVGGAEIYALMRPRATLVELTRVHAAPEGDAHFAALDPAEWTEITCAPQNAGPGDSASFTFLTYRRKVAHEPRASMSR